MHIFINALSKCLLIVLAMSFSFLCYSAEIRGKNYQFLYFTYLLTEYQSNYETLSQYAVNQGYIYPNEKELTVLHEMMHIDQAKHQGYKIINKGYTSFYLSDDVWQYISFEYVLSKIEKSQDNIYQLYMLKNPQLNLGNMIDELNVYNCMLSFFEKNADNDRVLEKQYMNIAHFLKYTNMYLGVMRQYQPYAYATLKQRDGVVPFLKELYFELYQKMDKTVFNKVYDKKEVLIFLR